MNKGGGKTKCRDGEGESLSISVSFASTSFMRGRQVCTLDAPYSKASIKSDCGRATVASVIIPAARRISHGVAIFHAQRAFYKSKRDLFR